jgi:uncharacterized alpha-E superfamily protein
MLSRTADHLYWMARYTERAENTARLLEVAYRMSLLPQSGERGYWGAALGITGLDKTYAARHGGIVARDVLDFMVLDADNPSSIMSSLRLARENAHAVRGTLTSETWETINSTWLDARDKAARQLHGSELVAFFDWVKYRSHLSRGVVVGTMLQDEAFHFIRLGTFLERGDNTARILDVKFDPLAPHTAPEVDYYEWGALLRAVSAFEIYRKVYRDVVTPNRVAELLMLRKEMPRSLLACMAAVVEILHLVANARSAETERLAGELHARLQFGRITAILEHGLHEFLTDFLEHTAEVGRRISEDFLVAAT